MSEEWTEQDEAAMNQQIEMAAMTVRHSQTLGKLTAALAQAQLEFKPIKKDTYNPYYNSKYADLANVIEATQPYLAKNDLVVMQFPSVSLNAKSLTLTTMMTHSSNEWIASDLAVPATTLGKDKTIKFDVQSIGSAETYTRRYAYQAIVGVAAEADDDGNAAVSAKTKDYEAAFDQREEEQKTLAAFQQDGLQDLAKTHGKTDAQLIAWMKVNCNVERIDKVLRRDFEKMKAFVLGKEPLQDTLHSSVEAHRSDSKPVNGTQGRRISEAQLKRLHAIRNKHNIPEQDVKRYVFELKGPESLSDLDPTMYNVVVSWMETIQA